VERSSSHAEARGWCGSTTFYAGTEAQNLGAGRFVPARSVPELHPLPDSSTANPRLGVVYDLFGNAKTA